MIFIKPQMTRISRILFCQQDKTDDTDFASGFALATIRMANASVTSVISEINVHPWGDKGIRDEREQCHQCHPLTLIIHRDASKLSNNSMVNK